MSTARVHDQLLRPHRQGRPRHRRQPRAGLPDGEGLRRPRRRRLHHQPQARGLRQGRRRGPRAGPQGRDPCLQRRQLAGAGWPGRRGLRRLRQGRHPGEQRRLLAAGALVAGNLRAALRPHRVAELQGAVPPDVAGRQPHGGGRRRFDHQHFQRRRAAPAAADRALCRRQGRAQRPDRGLRLRVRAQGAGEHHLARPLPDRRLQGLAARSTRPIRRRRSSAAASRRRS